MNVHLADLVYLPHNGLIGIVIGLSGFLGEEDVDPTIVCVLLGFQRDECGDVIPIPTLGTYLCYHLRVVANAQCADPNTLGIR